MTKTKKIITVCICCLLAVTTVLASSFIGITNVAAAEATVDEDVNSYLLRKTITPLEDDIYKAEVEVANKEDTYGDFYATLCIDISASSDIKDVKNMYRDILQNFKTHGSNIKVSLVVFGHDGWTGYDTRYFKQESKSAIGRNSFATDPEVYNLPGHIDDIDYITGEPLPRYYPAEYTFYTVNPNGTAGFFNVNDPDEYNILYSFADTFKKPLTARSPYDVAWDVAYHREISKAPVNEKQVLITVGDFKSTWTRANDDVQKYGAYSIAKLMQAQMPSLEMFNVLIDNTTRKQVNASEFADRNYRVADGYDGKWATNYPYAWQLAVKTTTNRPATAQGYDPDTWEKDKGAGNYVYDLNVSENTPALGVVAIYGTILPYVQPSENSRYSHFVYRASTQAAAGIDKMLKEETALKHYPIDSEIVIQETLDTHFEVLTSDAERPISLSPAIKASSTYTSTNALNYINKGNNPNWVTFDEMYSGTDISNINVFCLEQFEGTQKSNGVVFHQKDTENGIDNDILIMSIPFNTDVVGGNGRNTFSGSNGAKYKLTYYFKLKDNIPETDPTDVNTHITKDYINDLYSQVLLDTNGYDILTKGTLLGRVSSYLPGMDVTLNSGDFYYVKFNSNGRGGTMETQKINRNEDTALSPNTFIGNSIYLTLDTGAGVWANPSVGIADASDENSHKYIRTTTERLRGWATTADGEKVYNDKQTVNNLSEAGTSTTLYAVWYYDNRSLQYALPTPTREGYTFIEWNTKADGSGTGIAAGTTFKYTEDTTLYAIWRSNNPQTYIVTYDYATNGGTSVNIASKEFTTGDFFDPTPIAVKPGWNFVGWSLSNDSYEDILTNTNKLIQENNVTVYAVYSKELTAKFSSYETYNTTLKVDTPVEKTVTIYNNATYGDVEVPINGFSNIPAKGSYTENEIQNEYITSGSFVRRNAVFDPENFSNSTVRVTAETGADNFDAVYYTYLTLHYNSNGGSTVNDTSSMFVYKTAGVTDKTCIGDTLDKYTITSTVPTKDGYVFAGWTIPNADIDVKCFADNTLSTSAYPKLLNGDNTAIAQWVGVSITSQASEGVLPGSEIEYTIKGKTTDAVNKVTLSADIPAGTELVSEGLTTTDNGTKVVFVINDVGANSTVSKTYKVRIKDTAKDGDTTTANCSAQFVVPALNSTTKTITCNATPAVNTVDFTNKVTYLKITGESGTAPIDNTEYRGGMGELATLKTNTLTKTGYTFVGWLDINSKQAYKEGAKIPVNNNITLNALWAKISMNQTAEKVPGGEVKYTVNIEVPNYLDDIKIQDIIPKEINVTKAEVKPSNTGNTAIITHKSGETVNDKITVNLTKADEVNIYQLEITGTIDNNIAPGTEFKNKATMTCETGYTLNTSEVSVKLGYTAAYIIGDDYTVSTYSDGSPKYTGQDVLYPKDTEGNVIYYQVGEEVTLIEGPATQNNKFFDRWTGADAPEIGEEPEYTVSGNTVFYAQYIILKQSVTDKQTDYIPGEYYTTQVELSAISLDPELADGKTEQVIYIKGKTGTTPVEVVNKDDSFITKTELVDLDDDSYFIVTTNINYGETYVIECKGIINNAAASIPFTGEGTSRSRQTGFSIHNMAKYANDDNVEIAECYKLTYNVNGGTGDTPEVKYYRAGEEVTVAAGDGITMTTRTFNGWNTSTTGDGTSYKAGEKITLTEDMCLYAEWVLGAKLPETGSQAIAVVSALALVSVAVYLCLKKKDKEEM